MNAPITQAEEQQFYGTEVSAEEWQAEYRAAMMNYDDEDLQVAAFELSEPILAALSVGDYMAAGRLLALSRKATATRRAEFACFGHITTPEYTV